MILSVLAGEGSSLAPLPFPFSNLGAFPASALLLKKGDTNLFFSEISSLFISLLLFAKETNRASPLSYPTHLPSL